MNFSRQVLVDGLPLSDVDAAWFRQQLGVVSQVRGEGSTSNGILAMEWQQCFLDGSEVMF